MRQPTVYGKYLLLERVSVGGMAEVFKAKSFGEEGFEKILAIKRILPSMAEDDEFIEMFIDEAKISGQLSHPNIGQIYELGKIGDSHFIAMEFIWGKDVLQIQNRFRRLRKKIPLSMVAYVGSRVCEGLDYAHRKKDDEQTSMGLIHRDVSPQNVLVSYAGEVKIIDFGIAKARSRSSKTQAGVLKGKFGYMSPEQVRALPLDRRSDIFAIGTLLWEMTTGERLFTGETDFATLEKVRNAQVIPPSRVDPRVDPGLEAIILKALKRDPEDRYQWASEMQEELTAYYMTQDTIFTAKALSATASTLFEAERKREEKSLEEYLKIRKEDLDNFIDQVPERREAVSLLAQGRLMKSLDETLPESGEIDDQATQIGSPFLEEELGSLQILKSEELLEILEDDEDDQQMPPVGPAVSPGDNGRSHPAPIAASLAVQEPLPAEPTFIFNAESGDLVQVAEQSTVIFSMPKDNGEGAEAHNADQGPTVIFDAGLSAAIASAPEPAIVEESEELELVSIDVKPASTVKDILIGVLVAMFLIGGLLVWKSMRSAPLEVVNTGTMVITVTPPRVAEIFLNGQSKGMMLAGIPFTIKDVTAKGHEVVIKPQGGDPIKKTILVQSGGVQVIDITIKKPSTRAHLQLNITPESARVILDGAEISSAAIRSPLELSAGQRHEFRIMATGFQEEVFNIELKPEQKAQRTIALKKATDESLGTIFITSKPQEGMSVKIHGVVRGVTPLLLPEMKTGRFKVEVSKEGFNTQTRMAKVKAGKRLELRFKLKEKTTALASASDPNKPPVERKPTPRHKKDSTRPRDKTLKTSSTGGVEGYLVANTTPWAKVYVDGKDTGLTTPVAPRAKISLRPGKHKVSFEVKGKKYHFKVKITAGQVTRLIKRLPVSEDATPEL